MTSKFIGNTHLNQRYSDSNKWVSVISILIIGCVISALLSWGIIRFNRISELIIIKKRYPKIVFLESILAIFLVLIQAPLLLFTEVQFKFIDPELRLHLSKAVFALYPLTAHGFIWCETMRLWLMNFRLHYLNSIDNGSWQNEINSNAVKKNFYLLNRHTWGSFEWIWKKVLCIYLMNIIILVPLYAVFSWNFIIVMVDGTLYCIPALLIIVLYIKSPTMQDKFYYHFEFKATAWLIGTTLVLYVIANILALLVDAFVGIILAAIAAECIYGGMSLISTHLITSKVLKAGGIWIEIFNRTNTNSTRYIERQISKQLQLQSNSKNSNSMKNNLRKCFKNEDFLDSFAQHLFEEHSIETLLSYIEFSQYKILFHEKMHLNSANNNDNIDREFKSFEIDMTHSKFIPKSSIVYGTLTDNVDAIDWLEYFNKIALLLYKKYIKNGSKFEINIGSSLKNYYYNLFCVSNDDINIDDLFQIFDNCNCEMYRFLNASSKRFWKSFDKEST